MKKFLLFVIVFLISVSLIRVYAFDNGTLKLVDFIYTINDIDFELDSTISSLYSMYNYWNSIDINWETLSAGFTSCSSPIDYESLENLFSAIGFSGFYGPFLITWGITADAVELLMSLIYFIFRLFGFFDFVEESSAVVSALVSL